MLSHLRVTRLLLRSYSTKKYLGVAQPFPVFRSKYYTPYPGEVRDFIKRSRLPVKAGPSSVDVLIRCPTCVKKTEGIREHSLSLNVISGQYACSGCGNEGTWPDYLALEEGTVSRVESFGVQADGVELGAYHVDKLESIQGLAEHLHGLGLNGDVLESYGVHVGYWDGTQMTQERKEQYTPVLVFPLRDEQGTIQRLHVQPWTSKLGEAFYWPGHERQPSLFGYGLDSAEACILTGTELDAMAAHQMTEMPAFSLAHATQLPISTLSLLERYSSIYLWLGDDVFTQTAASKYAHKLGLKRTWIVSSTGLVSSAGSWTALQALTHKLDGKGFIRRAARVTHDRIVNFAQLREAIQVELQNPTQVQGVQSVDFPKYNTLLKGLRVGELTILTGPTGIGKTTFLSQLSLDFCKSGVPTLWGSFEISNTRLAKKMLHQFSGRDLAKKMDQFRQYAEQFEQLPLYFMKFYGTTQADAVLEVMHHALYTYDIQHVIIDNLQFMTSGLGHGYERWEIQDDTLSLFRKFATEHQVHVTLVVHPRKEDRESLDMNSVFGSAKVTQEADNVVILQKGSNGLRYFDIKKNRFDGTLGVMSYKFDSKTQKVSL